MMSNNNNKLDLKVVIFSFIAGSLTTIFVFLLIAFLAGTVDISISIGDNDNQPYAIQNSVNKLDFNYDDYIKGCLKLGGELQYCNCLYESELDTLIDCSNF